MRVLARILSCLLAALALAAPVAAGTRLKDIIDIEGVRENQLTGYGIVFGLNGTGDSLRNCAMTGQSLEAMLREIEKDTTGKRDPEKYYVSVFGTPGGKDPWAWRWEGHHQSFNYTSVDAAAPSMTRWSQLRLSGRIRRGTNCLPSQRGSIVLLHTPMMATSGALMMGVK